MPVGSRGLSDLQQHRTRYKESLVSCFCFVFCVVFCNITESFFETEFRQSFNNISNTNNYGDQILKRHLLLPNGVNVAYL